MSLRLAMSAADTSIVVEGSGSVIVGDEFESYEACLQASQRLEFEVSFGEAEMLADGFLRVPSSVCSSVLVNVSIVSISDVGVAHCLCKEVENVNREKFYEHSLVWLSRTHPCRDYLHRCARLKSFGCSSIEVQLPPDCDLDELQRGLWRVDADFAMYGLQWTLDGLSAFAQRRSEPLQRLIVEDLTSSEAEKLRRPMRGCPLSDSDDLFHLANRHRLTESQRRALEMSTETILLLIHGPPGTGKTQTIVALLDLYGRPGSPACCLAGANLAVDNACKRALKERVNIIRTGNIEGDKVQASMRPLYLEQMAMEAKGVGKHPKARKTRREWIRTYIKNEASVVASTCTMVCANYLQDTACNFIVVDEACQVNEPETVASLSKLEEGGRVALAGDPQQLGCVCMSSGAGGAGLETSLYERLRDVFVVPKCLLDIPYRMHPSISKWPNSEFYLNQLRNSASVSRLTKPRGFPWADGSSTAFIHVHGEEIKRGDSFYIEAEADVVWKVRVALLSGRCVLPGDIDILTWYDAQNKCMCKNFDMADSIVANVDGFQGSERPVMILSTVRTAPSGNIGFTKEPRRMNVALTRAKRALIVIGDVFALLEGDSYGHWKSWLQQVPMFNDQFQRIHDFRCHSSMCETTSAVVFVADAYTCFYVNLCTYAYP